MAPGNRASAGDHSNAKAKIPPTAPGLPVLGVLLNMLGNRPLYFLETARRQGDIIHLKLGKQDAYLLSHPDYVRHVLQDNDKNYWKGIKGEGFKAVLGGGLLTSNGDTWLRERRMIQASFQRARLASLADMMTDTTASVLERWRSFAARREPFDIKEEIDRLALSITVRTLFNAEIEQDVREVGRSLAVLMAFLDFRTNSLIRLPLALPTPRHQTFRRALRAIDAVVNRIIAERRRSGRDAGDLLSLLLSARDEATGAGLSEASLHDHVRTFLLAGYETVATALTWTCYLLSKHPGVERRLHAEVTAALGGRAPTVEDLPRLSYVQMVLQEAMRLYPPAWLFTREAFEDDVIGGYSIPARAMILISPFVIHRHAGFWSNPEGFDPDRFAPELASSRPRFAYLPFGGGPHICIGNHFAMMEMQIVLSMLVQRCALHLVPGPAVEVHPVMVLRSRSRLLMTAHPRD